MTADGSRTRALDDRELQIAMRLYSRGIGYEPIAFALDAPREHVRHRLQSAGVEIRRRGAPRHHARGYQKPGHTWRKINVGFDPDTWQEIRTWADAENVTFSEAVRLFVEWQLEELSK